MEQAEQILAVGDLHGRCDLLEQVLGEMLPALPPPTRLVFLGDYIDRGPASAQVVEALISLKAQRPGTVLLMGNHERMLLNALQGQDPAMFLANGGRETLESYGLGHRELHKLPAPHLELISSLALMHQTDDYIFVHAGLRPGVPLAEQQERDLLWIRWEFIDSPEDFGKTVVFGHTPFQSPLRRPHRIGIDTGAVYGNRLTCLKLPEIKLLSLPSSSSSEVTHARLFLP